MVHIEFPEEYPSKACLFSIHNDEKELPAKLQLKIQNALNSRAAVAYEGRKTEMVLGLLKFLDNNLERYLVDREITQTYHNTSTQCQKRRQMCSHRGGKRIGKCQLPRTIDQTPPPPSTLEEFLIVTNVKELSKEKTKNQIPSPTRSTSLSSKSAVGSNISERELMGKPKLVYVTSLDDNGSASSKSEHEKHEEAAQVGMPTEIDESEPIPPSERAFGSTTAHRGIQILLEKTELDNIGIMSCRKLRCILMCNRCRQQEQVTLTNQQAICVECCKCHQGISLLFRADSIHETSSVLGYIDPEGCLIVDVLPSTFIASCLTCSEQNTIPTLSFSESHQLLNCRSCHARMSVRVESVSTKKVKRKIPSELMNAKIQRRSIPKKEKLLGIRQGTPLPQKGTCKHYKSSYRWLRFPCCGRAFPCDVCHDLASDHPMQWAKRMICGWCSREQPYSNKGCKFCSKSMAKDKGKRFWEGGQGCRNTAQMSKSDPRKYKNRAKTVSKRRSAKA